MENNLENLTIGVFARTAGVNVETIRFYQRKGLLPEPDKPYGSIRRYGETDVTRVRFVKSAQRLGFSLDEIAELLRLEDGTHCEEASSNRRGTGIKALRFSKIVLEILFLIAYHLNEFR
jgi:MerR family mercuric resistance operon transcriptional regulator